MTGSSFPQPQTVHATPQSKFYPQRQASWSQFPEFTLCYIPSNVITFALFSFFVTASTLVPSCWRPSYEPLMFFSTFTPLPGRVPPCSQGLAALPLFHAGTSAHVPLKAFLSKTGHDQSPVPCKPRAPFCFHLLFGLKFRILHAPLSGGGGLAACTRRRSALHPFGCP